MHQLINNFSSHRKTPYCIQASFDDEQSIKNIDH